MDSDFLEFSEDPPSDAESQPLPAWKILVVDDESEVHRVTHLVLDGFEYQNRAVDVIEARSAAEAMELLNQHTDLAVVLLDVVMETDDAGFRVVEHIRNTMGNSTIRIILRTGQPGQAPARKVIQQYAINDYHSKADLSAERMYIAIYTAISMFDHLETIARREQQLQLAYAEIEQLVHISSHDLQEPLLSVSTLSDRLLDAKQEQLDAEGQQYLHYIGAAVRRMGMLVKGLLDHSRLGRPQTVEKVKLDELVDDLRAQMAEPIHRSGAEFQCASLPEVFGERPKIRLLLEHLMTNALTYRHPDRAPRVRISAETTASGPVFRVQDNGIGIPEEHHLKIFDVFFRLHHRDELEGTGIGLAHCRKIVTQHGGQIWVESTPGEGACFCFTLPGAPNSS